MLRTKFMEFAQGINKDNKSSHINDYFTFRSNGKCTVIQTETKRG